MWNHKLEAKWDMAQYAQTKNAATALDYINTTTKKGRLYAQNAHVTSTSDIDSQAAEYAKEFLTLIGKPSEDIAVNMCERCHIDNTDLYASELWKLPGKEIFIWPMEGCPKPS